MSESIGKPITFSEAFEASQLADKKRNRCLITASMFLPPLEDNQVIDDATLADGEVAFRLQGDQWNQLFNISSYLYKGVVIQLRQ